jgi:Na+/H+ antiporter NhaD/arsenite permease-like protein
MTPVLDYLKDNADKFGISEPWQFFFLTGVLSSFLDNAPTYLTFFSLAQGLSEKFGLTPQVAGVWEPFLKAISCGAVFFGANTYIGNAPNFMVKSISEEMRIKAPNFIAYLLYSFLILLPSFFVIAYIFFGFGR